MNTSMNQPVNQVADTEPLTPGHILEIAHAVADAAHLDATDARTITFTNNAVVRLPRAGAVIRVPGSTAIERKISTVLNAATVFAAHGVPAIQSYPGLPLPIRAAGRYATVWVDAQDDASGPAQPHHLADILLTLHAITGPQPFPEWRPIHSIRRRMEHDTVTNAGERAFLEDECAELDCAVADLASIEPLIPAGLVHGDAFMGNLIPARGGPVICDFDSTCIGPREWDLTPIAVGALRMDYGSRTHHDFAAAYGVDVTTWPVSRYSGECANSSW